MGMVMMTSCYTKEVKDLSLNPNSLHTRFLDALSRRFHPLHQSRRDLIETLRVTLSATCCNSLLQIFSSPYLTHLSCVPYT